jgi:Protein of unknown function (DUF2934)
MPKKRTAENERIVPAASAAAPVRRKVAPRTRAKHTVEAVESISASISEPVIAAVETAEVAAAVEPTREAIAQLAYSFWEGRGCQGGSPEEDWQRAEQQLRLRVPVVA